MFEATASNTKFRLLTGSGSISHDKSISERLFLNTSLFSCNLASFTVEYTSTLNSRYKTIRRGGGMTFFLVEEG